MDKNYKYVDDSIEEIKDAIKDAKANLEMEGFIISCKEENDLIKQFKSNEKLLLLIKRKKKNEK